MQTSLARAPRTLHVSHLLDALLSWRGVLVYWSANALVFGLARYSVSRTLALDEARTVEMAQEFAAGYTARQPPLYDQASWLLAQLLGPGAPSHLVLRFVCIALIGLLTFAAVARATGQERSAAAASLSLSFHYFFGWYHHQWGTHTLVLCMAALWSFVALIDFAERPGGARALLLGAAIGLGLVSKFSFLLFLAGLFGAALTLPDLRRAAQSPWIVAAGVVALAVCAPYLIWLASVHADVLGTVQTHLVQTRQSHLVRALVGLGLLLWSLVAFTMPWAAIIAALVPRAFDPRVRRDVPPTLGERLAARTTVIAAALAAAGIVAAGATNVGERYMHPLLVLAPVIVFGRLAGVDGTAPKLRLVAGAAVSAAVVLVALRLALPTIDNLTQKTVRTANLPFEALAAQMAARGYDHGTALATDVREAGNLRSFLPRLRVVADVDSHRAVRTPPRPDAQGKCFAVARLFTAQQGQISAGDVAGRFETNALEPLGNEPLVLEVRVGSGRGARRLYWGILDLRPESAACR
ncbi:MAG TPA: glycosyltransferase family 39 protein [Beijerinckiaceae bacterium]|jgi:4-amino-4-deoxy-L-arabinose transferase-like glycosyltransferase